MHTDMGNWRKQGTQNTSICSKKKKRKKKDSGEAARRSENMKENAINIRAQLIGNASLCSKTCVKCS